MVTRRASLASLLVVLLACAETPEAPAVCESALMEFEAFEVLEASEDPFPDRLAELICAAEAVKAEDFGGEPSLSINTGECNYVTARAPLLAALSPGDHLALRVWHFPLLGSPAEAHLSIAIDDERVLDQVIPIPAPGRLTDPEVVVTAAHAVGAPIYFHLHNHGANYWSLLEISRLSCAD